MRISFNVLVSAAALVGFGIAWSAGCSGHAGYGNPGGSSGDSGIPPESGPGSAECPSCVTGSDCADGWTCAQFQGDIFCAPACGPDNSCPSGRTCSLVSEYNGSQVSVCVPDNNACMASNPPPPHDGGCPPPPACDSGSSDMCGTLAAPSVSAGCSSCSGSSSSCQPNGCYGGWWCDTSTNRCQSPPEAGSCPAPSCPPAPPCGSSGGDSGSPQPDASPPPTGTITGSGGTLSSLLFAVVGDTRPANEDDTAGYPTSIITKIFADIEGSSPAIPFVVGTGDYEFASTYGSTSATQLNLYLGARKPYSGVFFPAMGNHECTGATASNCGPSGSDGETNNYKNFLSMFLGPIGQSNPYYSVEIDSSTGAWTSKFVFVAGNAWSSAQSSWLSSTMSKPTTYTFVIRHESSGANTAPGVSPSDSIINSYPYTALIVGHTHTYEWYGSNQVIIGNGGAPLSGSGNYGYGLVSQRSDGNIVFDMIDYMSLKADSSFHTVLTPTGNVTH